MWKAFQKYYFYIGDLKIATYPFVTYTAAHVILITLTIGLYTYTSQAVPKYREFSSFDPSILYTYYPDSSMQIRNWQMIIFNGLFTLIQMCLILFLNKRWNTLSYYRKCWNVMIFILGWLLSVVTNFSVILPLKTLLAVYRPDFVSRCAPLVSSYPDLGSLIDVLSCTNAYGHTIVRDGAMAFPSGMSGIIFNNLTYILLLKRNTHQKTNIWLNYGPTLISGIISCWHLSTRFSDNRSSLLDLFGGAIIGVFSSYVSFWFLFDRKTGIPLPPLRYSFEFNINDEGGCYKFEGDNIFEYDDSVSYSINECVTIMEMKAKQANEERPSKKSRFSPLIYEEPIKPTDNDEELANMGTSTNNIQMHTIKSNRTAAQSLRFNQSGIILSGTVVKSNFASLDQGSRRM